MISLRAFATLVLWFVFTSSLLRGDTTISVPPLSTGQPGESRPAFPFTTEFDGVVTIKAMFMTHWLTNRTNVVANPKAVRFTIDENPFPAVTGTEDFYGYMDQTVWPERAAAKDQQIWIEETIFLRRGSHTIQFRNGLMERDDSGSRPIYSSADWMTASVTVPSGGRRDLPPPAPLVLPQPAVASIFPATRTVISGSTATFALESSGASKTEVSGTDKTLAVNPGTSITVSPLAGTYIFNYVATGTALVYWLNIEVDEIWIDPPSGSPVNVTTDLYYIAQQSGDFRFRVITAGTTVSKSFHVDLPTTLASATLIVTGGAGLAPGPQVTEFSPVAASFTVQNGVTAHHSYNRSWQEHGAWYAYLGRDGVGFRVVGQSPENAVRSFEIQAKSPSGDWYVLTSGSPSADGNHALGVPVPQTFSVKLGENNPAKPLLPADPLLAGTWSVRARVSDTTGTWSPWSFEQPLNVIYPVKDVSVTGKTLPPVTDGDWFTESPQISYTYQVLVP